MEGQIAIHGQRSLRWLLLPLLLTAACKSGSGDAPLATNRESGSTVPAGQSTTQTRLADGDPTTSLGTTVPETKRETFAKGTIPAVLAADGRFQTLLRLLVERSPVQLSLMSGNSNHSLMAPTDGAFAALPPEALEPHFVDETRTRDFFHRHIVQGTPWTAADLMADVRSSDGFVPAIANAGFLRFSIVDDTILEVVLCELDGTECQPLPTMEPITLIETDIQASNGLIHVIDGILIPPDD